MPRLGLTDLGGLGDELQRKEQQAAALRKNKVTNAGEALLKELQQENGMIDAENVFQSGEAARMDKARRAALDTNELYGKQVLRLLDSERQFGEAGVPISDMIDGKRIQDIVGRLESNTPGGIPGPFVYKSDNDPDYKGPRYEKRIHTKEVTSPLTGEKEIVPFKNPETGKPLETVFGDARRMPIDGIEIKPDYFVNGLAQQGDRASEYLGLRSGWLMGQPSMRLNNTSSVTDPDYVLNDGTHVDAQIKFTGQDADAQVYTKIRPNSNMDEAGVKDAITTEMKRRGGSLPSAKDRLTRQGVFRNEYDYRGNADYALGKSLSVDQSGKYKHDYIIQPSLPEREAKANMRFPTHLKDKTVIAPEKIELIDVAKVRDRLATSSADEIKPLVQVRGTRGSSGQGAERFNLGLRLPAGSEEVADMSKAGYVPQIMRNLRYATSNPMVRAAGVGLAAVPVLGDAADAATGAVDVATKKGDAQVRGGGNLAAGTAGLAALAAPAAAPILAPISAGLGIGNAAADMTLERRKNSKDLTINSDKGERAGAFIHSEANPVTISGPSVVQNEWERRRAARRGASRRPTSAGEWWNQALGALGLP